MIKEECKNASKFLCKLFDGDYVKVATIVTAEANNDYGTLRKMLLCVQDEIGRLVVALKSKESLVIDLKEKNIISSIVKEYKPTILVGGMKLYLSKKGKKLLELL